jgi:hypothetical protein
MPVWPGVDCLSLKTRVPDRILFTSARTPFEGGVWAAVCNILGEHVSASNEVQMKCESLCTSPAQRLTHLRCGSRVASLVLFRRCLSSSCFFSALLHAGSVGCPGARHSAASKPARLRVLPKPQHSAGACMYMYMCACLLACASPCVRV